MFEKKSEKTQAAPQGLSRKKGALTAVIVVEPHTETINFCVMNETKTSIRYNVANYKVSPFDQEFFDRFAKIIKLCKEKYPDLDLQKTAIVLPDQLFLLDMVSVPMIHRKAMQHSLSLAIEAIYNNAADLNLVTYSVQQNKQYATYGLAGMRRDILEMLHRTCAENGVGVAGVTFASNAMVNGAFALNPKLKGGTFLMLDIKENYARFAFVVRGCTMGYYDLPFGHGMLYKSRMAAEDLLFDHRAGELLVLNAKERAKAKQLTMEGGLPENGEENAENTGAVYESAADGTVKKTGRKLPKFMLRPTPQTREEYIYENFRIFVKWALDLIEANPDIASLADLDTVYVSMPPEFVFLFDVINAERDEHGVTFEPLLYKGVDETVAENLEMYGGFFVNQYNEANAF